VPGREVATQMWRSGRTSGAAAVTVVAVCVAIALNAYAGFRLGATERSEDPVRWLMTAHATAALSAGAVAGICAGVLALVRRRLWTISFTIWFLCAGVFTGGWARGMSEELSPPASDLPLVFVATLLFAAGPALGLSALVYGIWWLFDHGAPPSDRGRTAGEALGTEPPA